MRSLFQKLKELLFGRDCTNHHAGCRGKAVRGNYCQYCWDRALLNSFRYKTWRDN